MRRAAVFNAISILFLLLTLLTMGFVVVRMAGLPLEQQVAAFPTLIPTSFFPTDTPSLTPTPSFTATVPPSLTPTFTLTPSITNSVTPSLTFTPIPSPTLTFTPSITTTPLPPTVTFTPTGPTITPSPLPPTVNPYVFGLREPVILTANAYNTLGCAWQGIGGQVFDINNIEVLQGQYQIRVFDANFTTDIVRAVGTNSQYGGPSGWEVQTGAGISNASYFVRLETTFGTPISENVVVQFPNDCAQAVAIVKFIQLREP